MKSIGIIPVKHLNYAKSRLSSILSINDRIKLCLLMLTDVLNALTSSRLSNIIVISPDDRVLNLAKSFGVDAVNIDLGLNESISYIKDIVNDFDLSIVTPLDIPLIEPIDIDEIIDLSLNYNVVISPSHDMRGTNILCRKPPNSMETFFGDLSFKKHVDEATRRGLKIKIYVSPRVSIDIDSSKDLNAALKYCREHNISKQFISLFNSK
jgi:2-phospho-L-lactate guanylyltransferase